MGLSNLVCQSPNLQNHGSDTAMEQNCPCVVKKGHNRYNNESVIIILSMNTRNRMEFIRGFWARITFCDHLIDKTIGKCACFIVISSEMETTGLFPFMVSDLLLLNNVYLLSPREVYHTKRMQRVMCVCWSQDDKYIISGSDEMNLRVWKANASEKLGVVSWAWQITFTTNYNSYKSTQRNCKKSFISSKQGRIQGFFRGGSKTQNMGAICLLRLPYHYGLQFSPSTFLVGWTCEPWHWSKRWGFFLHGRRLRHPGPRPCQELLNYNFRLTIGRVMVQFQGSKWVFTKN